MVKSAKDVLSIILIITNSEGYSENIAEISINSLERKGRDIIRDKRLEKRRSEKEMPGTYNSTYNVYKPGYIDIICLIILWLVFFVALFLTDGIWFIADILLLAITAAVLGKTVAEMKIG